MIKARTTAKDMRFIQVDKKEVAVRKVFISYHRADTRQKNRLVEELQLQHINYYVVPDDANYNGIHNQEICQEILKEMDKCDCVICLVGKETYQRPHVDYELKYAFHKRKGIVVLLIENRKDSVYAPNKSTFPPRLNDNMEYIAFSQFASGMGNIEILIKQANNNAGSRLQIKNTRKCMPLRNKKYYDN